MKSVYSIGSDITITRVKNGWILHMPKPHVIPEYPDVGTEMAQGIKAAMPIIKDMYKKLHKDPLLEELQQEQSEEEEWQEFDAILSSLQKESMPAVGVEENIYICNNVNDLLMLLGALLKD